jgi:hypothetical protein
MTTATGTSSLIGATQPYGAIAGGIHIGILPRRAHKVAAGLGSSLIVIGAVLLAVGLILKCSGMAPRASSFLFTCPATPKWYSSWWLGISDLIAEQAIEAVSGNHE